MDVRALLTRVDDQLAVTHRLLERALVLGRAQGTIAPEPEPEPEPEGDSKSSSSSISATASSTASLGSATARSAQARMVLGGRLTMREEDGLKARGELLTGVELLKAQFAAGLSLDSYQLARIFGRKVSRAELRSHPSDLAPGEAQRRLDAMSEPTSSSSSSEQDDGGGEPDAKPNTTERKLANLRFGQPDLERKIRRALLKEQAQEIQGPFQGLVGPMAGRIKEAKQRRRSKQNLELVRARLEARTKVKGLEGNLYSSNLYDTNEALRDDERKGMSRDRELLEKSDVGYDTSDDRFRSLHLGEHDVYNVSDQVAKNVLGGFSVEGGRVTTLDDDEGFTTVKTRALSKEERAQVEVHGGEGGLRRKDGRLHDSSEAEALLSFDGTVEGKEMYVVTDDGKILSSSQRELTLGVTAFQEAAEKLHDETGRWYPKDLEEAEKYGFPTEILIGHHTTFTGSEQVRGAGEMRTRDGKVLEISSASGHYQPHAEATFRAVETFDRMGAIVHGLGRDSTRVKVTMPDGTPKTFDGVVVLAAGGDLNRALLLQKELDARKPGDEVDPRLVAYRAAIEAHEARTKDLRTKLADDLLAAQSAQVSALVRLDERSARVEEQLKALGEGGDPEVRAQLARELEAIEADHESLATGLAATRAGIDEGVRTIRASLDTLAKDLAAAGAEPAAIELALSQQRVGVGRLSLAQLELVVILEDQTKRRRELEALRELAKGDDFKQRKSEAKKALERLFGGGRPSVDDGTPDDDTPDDET